MDIKQVKKIAMDVENDMRNQSRESLIHTFNDLFFDHKQEVKDILTEQTEKLLQSVDNKIETKVNGSIKDFRKENEDMYKQLMIEIGKLQTETKPATLVTSGAKKGFKGFIWLVKAILWLAGSITVVRGAYLVIINITKIK